MNLKRLKLMRGAARVQRNHTTPAIYRQSVGEHTFGTLAILNEIYVGSNESRARLMLSLMVHDVPELITGDVPAPAKWEYHGLETALRAAEKYISLKYSLLDPELSEQEQKICKFCDLMELAIYSLEELDMGNRNQGVQARNALHGIVMLGISCVTDGAEELYNQVYKDFVTKCGNTPVIESYHGTAFAIKGVSDV